MPDSNYVIRLRYNEIINDNQHAHMYTAMTFRMCMLYYSYSTVSEHVVLSNVGTGEEIKILQHQLNQNIFFKHIRFFFIGYLQIAKINDCKLRPC